MNLKIYRNEASPGCELRDDFRTVCVNRSKGTLYFNKKAMLDFGLSTENRVVVAQDEDSRNDWYLCFTGPDDKAGARLRKEHKRCERSSIKAHMLKAARAILDSAKVTNSATFIIAASPTITPDGTEWYRILTANPIMTR